MALVLIRRTPDTTAPTVQSATLAANGTTFTLTFNEPVTFASSPSADGLTITPSGGAATLTYASGNNTSSLVFSASRTILDSETITCSYDSGTGDIQDLAGNALASFTDQAVTNNSTQTGSTDTLRPVLFGSVPSHATAEGYAPYDLSDAVQTNIVGTTRAAVIEIAGGTYTEPYSCNVADRTYRLMGHVVFDGCGFTVDASNITIDFNGYTITYHNVDMESVTVGTVTTSGAGNGSVGPTLTSPTGLTLSANSHLRFVIEFLDGDEEGNHYEVYDSTSTVLTLENHTPHSDDSAVTRNWQNGGPAEGDTFRIYNPRLVFGVGTFGGIRSGVEIINGNIIEGAASYGRGCNLLGGHGCNPIYSNNSTGWVIGGVSATWHSDNVSGVVLIGGSHTLSYCEVDDQGTFVSNRQRTTHCIDLGSGSTATYFRIRNSRHGGFALRNNDTIHHFEVYGDSRATNAYGIGTYGGQGNTAHTFNIFMVGEHAIGIANHSNPAQNNEYYDGWIECQTTRLSSEFDWNYASAISNRWDNGARTLGNSWHDLALITYAEDDGPVSISRSRTVWFASLETATSEVVRDSFIAAYNRDDSTECHCVGLVTHNSNAIFRNCKFVGTHDIIWLHDQTYGDSLAGGRFIDCEYTKAGSDPAFGAIRTGTYRPCNVDIIGGTFNAGTAADDIVGPSDADNVLRYGFNLTVTVTSGGSPVEGAIVTVRDKDTNILRDDFVTDANGEVIIDVPTYYLVGTDWETPITLNALTVEAVDGAESGSNTISPTSDDAISVGIAA